MVLNKLKLGPKQSSFEKLFRKNRADGEIHGEFSNTKMKTIEGRIGVWTSDEGVIGRPYVSLLDTLSSYVMICSCEKSH